MHNLFQNQYQRFMHVFGAIIRSCKYTNVKLNTVNFLRVTKATIEAS